MESATPDKLPSDFPGKRPMEPALFERIFDEFKGPLYRFFCRLAESSNEAEDLFQETWLRVVRSGACCPGPEGFRPWVFTVAVNLHRDALRKTRLRRLLGFGHGEDPERAEARGHPFWRGEEPSHEARLEQAELRSDLRRALAALPAKQRRVFLLKEVEGFKHAEIAHMLGLPVNTVKTLLHRGVIRLRRSLEERRPGALAAAAPKENAP